MKKTLVLVLTLALAGFFVSCSQPSKEAKPTKEEYSKQVKLKLYDAERKIDRLDRAAAAKKIKAKQASAAKASREQFEALQDKVSEMESAAADNWDSFTAGIESGMANLNFNLEQLLQNVQEEKSESVEKN